MDRYDRELANRCGLTTKEAQRAFTRAAGGESWSEEPTPYQLARRRIAEPGFDIPGRK